MTMSSKKYHGLFSPTVKHTEFLFGGNLQEKIAQVTVENKNTKYLMKPRESLAFKYRRGGDYRYHAYSYPTYSGGYHGYGRGSFRSRGRPFLRARGSTRARGRGMRGISKSHNKGKEVS